MTIGPCEVWATTDEIFACGDLDSGDFDAELIEKKAIIASNTLYQLSAQQFRGECDAVVYPCHRSRPRFSTIVPGRFWMGNGPWSFGCGCHDNSSCSCAGTSRVGLGLYPIRDIIEVIVDGEVVDPSVYRVEGSRWLVRTDGTAWPCCPSTDTDFSVEFTYGREVPEEGRAAASTLAYELLLSCAPTPSDAKKCRLPRNIQSITRQGVSMTFDPSTLLTTRPGQPVRFGISEIDMFLLVWAPYGQRTQSIVLTPDIPPEARRYATDAGQGS